MRLPGAHARSNVRSGTMAAVVVRAVAAALASRIGNVLPVLERFGIDPLLLGDPDARIPTSAAFALYEHLGEISGDPDFGLHVGAELPRGALEVFEHATTISRTLAEALEKFARYYPLLIEHVDVKLETIGDLARFTHRPIHPLVSPRHSVEMLFGGLMARSQDALGRPWPLRLVRFHHERPASTAEHERIFRAPIEFRQPVSEIVFDRALLGEPLLTGDATLSPVLDRFVEKLLAELPAATPFLASVRHAVEATLRGGDPNVETTARRLAMSVRSLQRRLAEEQTTYNKVVDQVRRELATEYLSQQRLGVAEIAYLLGFAQPGAFHRAFRRWTGQSPKDYRAALRR